MAAVVMEWESRLGRRLRVRDLYILTTVARVRSMAKAARELRMSQPSVSEAIANLEHVLGVRLLDRSPRGVEPTNYAYAILKRSAAVFDELKQGIRDIEFLADPTTGTLNIGCPESIAATMLPYFAEHYVNKYPGVSLRVEDVPSPAIRSPALRERKFDLILARWPLPLAIDEQVDDVDIDPIFDDPLVVVAGTQSRWAQRRREIDLAELANEPWILSPPGTWNYEWLAREFKARGLGLPKVAISTFNVHLNSHFLRNGSFLTTYPRSWALLNAFKIMSVNLPVQEWPLSIITLKNRTPTATVEGFIGSAREVAKAMAVRLTRSA
jgi:DNA-binding transcriptional LysR family regulator